MENHSLWPIPTVVLAEGFDVFSIVESISRIIMENSLSLTHHRNQYQVEIFSFHTGKKIHTSTIDFPLANRKMTAALGKSLVLSLAMCERQPRLLVNKSIQGEVY